MVATPDKSIATSFEGARTQERTPSSATPPSLVADAEPDLQRDFEQLRERFRRTTTALTSAAHDLKTPLAILNGYTELLQSEKLGSLNERQREVLSDMASNGQRLQHFIQDFLTFSVLETGELRMQYEVGDINVAVGGLSPLVSSFSGTWP